MRLSQLSTLNGARGATAVRTFLTESPFLTFMDLNSGFELDAMSFRWRPTTASLTAAERALGGATTATDLTWADEVTGSQTIMGSGIDVDIRNKKDAERGLNKLDIHLEKQLLRAYKTFAKSVEARLFNGTGSGSPAQMKGLKTILNGTDDLPGYTGVKGVINAKDYSKETTPVSLDMSVANAPKYFSSLMLNVLNDVPNAKGIIMNSKLFAAISQFPDDQRRLGTTDTNYGIKLRTLWDIPVYILDSTSIASNEADDTATPLTNTTSMYVIDPGETKCSLVTNSGVEYWEFDHQENKESGREKWEMSMAWKIEDTASIRRVRNFKV